MSSELEVLRQRIIELKAENVEISNLRRKVSEFDVELNLNAGLLRL